MVLGPMATSAPALNILSVSILLVMDDGLGAEAKGMSVAGDPSLNPSCNG